MRFAARNLAAWILVSVLLVGYSEGVKTHPVRGRVELKDGDVGLLTGSHVEFMQEADPQIRPSGKIAANASFAMETIAHGKIAPGAPAGQYKARIVLGDESDAEVPKRKGSPIHKRYLDFATSGLTITVPSADYAVIVTAK
jgi:hypothetical protein